MSRLTRLVCCLAVAFPPSLLAADLPIVRSGLHDQTDMAVTIYNDNLALVKDQRKLNLPGGTTVLELRDVSAQMQPETALLKNLQKSGSFSVLEQNFDYDLLTPEKLLEKYVGKTVRVVKTNPATGAETTEQAQVLSANNGTVLRIGNRIETGVPGRIIYDVIPGTLRDRPTLTVQLLNEEAGERNVELSYLTSGLSWKADYVAELDANESRMDLSAWVTLNNTTGTAFHRSKLRLVAGDVHRVKEIRPLMIKNARAEADDVAATVTTESFLEYHLYTLDSTTNLAENQTKQVTLLTATQVPVQKELILQGADYYYGAPYGEIARKLKVGVVVEFDNKKAGGLGVPLPKGILRVYMKDAAGNVQFVGEDKIDHTPRNQTVRLKLGNAFDVVADKKQIDFVKIAGAAREIGVFESAYEVVIHNAKKEAVIVKVQEPVPGDWQMLQESHPSSKVSSHMTAWNIAVPGEGQATLKYRARVKY